MQPNHFKNLKKAGTLLNEAEKVAYIHTSDGNNRISR